MSDSKIGRFDQVQIRTTKNVLYLSAPPTQTVTPDGLWSVVAIIAGTDLLLAKNNALIRIPMTDVLKISEWNITTIVEPLGRLTQYGERQSKDRKKRT